jgi:hypothetical protein
MKLYLAAGTYYEKQADVPKGTKFEPVEFIFTASPKADFVAWMNNAGKALAYAEKKMDLLTNQPVTFLEVEAGPIAKPVGPCASTLPSLPKEEMAFRREVEKRWPDTPLTWRLDLGMLAFEDARSVVKS